MKNKTKKLKEKEQIEKKNQQQRIYLRQAEVLSTTLNSKKKTE
jgi:hypothetical protein